MINLFVNAYVCLLDGSNEAFGLGYT